LFLASVVVRVPSADIIKADLGGSEGIPLGFRV